MGIIKTKTNKLFSSSNQSVGRQIGISGNQDDRTDLDGNISATIHVCSRRCATVQGKSQTNKLAKTN